MSRARWTGTAAYAQIATMRSSRELERRGPTGRLGDKAEQDDNCAQLYNKSPFYLVSNALEDELRIPLVRGGVPLLGMQSFVAKDQAQTELFGGGQASWIVAPNQELPGSPAASGARHHGDFDDDDDEANVAATLLRILGKVASPTAATLAAATAAPVTGAALTDKFAFAASKSSLERRRRLIDSQTRRAPT